MIVTSDNDRLQEEATTTGGRRHDDDHKNDHKLRPASVHSSGGMLTSQSPQSTNNTMGRGGGSKGR